MIKIKSFVFSPFSENTFLLIDENKSCIIVDPGCYEQAEKEELRNYIATNELNPVRLLNTHSHLDHIFGNAFVHREYGLLPELHRSDMRVFTMFETTASIYGFGGAEPSPEPKNWLEEGDVIEFGNCRLEVIFVPGHSPGHVAFVCHEEKFVVLGDVLFQRSIGRTDLPGGNFETLIESIRLRMMVLDDDYTVYCGHGPNTTIGEERRENPFLN